MKGDVTKRAQAKKGRKKSKAPASASSSSSNKETPAKIEGLLDNLHIEEKPDNEELVPTTLPTGKVTTELPKEYFVSNGATSLKETPANSFEFAPDFTRVHTTVPPMGYDDTLLENPDGWAECIFDDPDIKKFIYSLPGFPHPLTHPPSPVYKIDASPSGGTGMFASTNLKVNDLIRNERPLLIAPTAIKFNIAVPNGKTISQAEKIMVVLAEHEKILEISFGRMLPELQAAYLALANAHLEDGSGPLMGIMRTNAFGTTFEQKGKYHSAVYKDLSRINHSCLPNASVVFNHSTFSGELRAIRDIKSGEEIFVPYCLTSDPLPLRQEKLGKYGFTCQCRLCTDPEIENLRRRIISSARNLDSYLSGASGNLSPEQHERKLQEICGWIAKIEEAGLEDLREYNKYLQCALWAYKKLDIHEEGVKVAEKWMAVEHAKNGFEGMTKVFTFMVPHILGAQIQTS